MSGEANFKKTKIAVLDFELHGNKFATTELGKIVSEWFITSLVKDGRFEVIERALLQKILEEQKLGISGAIDDSSASKIGKILGVKNIVTGSVLNLAETLEINARIINVENASIVAAENVKCPPGSDLQRFTVDLTAKIVKNFPLTGYIVKKDSTTVMIDLGRNAGVCTGMEFVVFKEGNSIKHPKTGEVLDVERLHTGRIKISHVDNNIAEAVIVKEETEGIEYGHLVNSVHKKRTAPLQVSLGEGWSLDQKAIENTSDSQGKLTIISSPEGASVRIKNIGSKYFPGIELPSGKYQIEVSKATFHTSRQWITLEDNSEVICTVNLKPEPKIAATPTAPTRAPGYEPSTPVAPSIIAPTEPPPPPPKVSSPLIGQLRSENYTDKIAAAKKILEQGTQVADNAVFDEVEKELLAGYVCTGKSNSHIDAMAYLVKALATSHNPKYMETLEKARDQSQSFKLSLYATKACLVL